MSKISKREAWGFFLHLIMETITTSRVLIFDTEDEGNAYTSPLRYSDIAVIKGDKTRFKRGDGKTSVTGGFHGSTFAELPWFTVGSGGGTLTDGNGTTADGTAVDLGGLQTDDININTNGNEFSIKDSATRTGLDITTASGEQSVSLTFNNNSGESGSVSIDATDGSVLQFNNGSGLISSVGITLLAMIIKDNLNSKGLAYAADYSPNSASNPRWIPDMAAVQAWVTANFVHK